MDAQEPNTLDSASLFSLSLHRLKRLARPIRNVIPLPPFFKIGRNVEGLYPASKVSFLIDADSFFRVLVEAIAKAETQIAIVGWDTDSRTELPLSADFPWPISEADRAKGSISFGDLLTLAVSLKPDLKIHILSWDYSFIYLFERETLPALKFSHLSSERIRFVLDHEHPTMASHHQKIVVVDDRVAFSGGLDITQRRWDTQDHMGHDPRRVDPGGHSYGPFHDIQICVEGEIARALGKLVRRRWLNATGETLLEPARSLGDRWPESAEIDFENVEVGLSRTIPFGFAKSEDRAGSAVIEVERLFLDTIRLARRFVYIENQYFTSPILAKAIAKRLREPDGPEFVMVLPRDQTGWIEESTMGLLRSEALRIVEKDDLFGRFKAYYPVVPHLTMGYVKVHSKLMIADDTFVRVGSANMNSRSLGVDTECDLSIHAGDRVDVKTAIARLRRELIGEHLGVDPAEFEARFLINGSLVDTVESFRGGERTLLPMRPTVPAWVANVVPPADWIDPRAPKGIRRWFQKRLHLRAGGFSTAVTAAITVAVLAILLVIFFGLLPEEFVGGKLAAFWKWTRSFDSLKIAESLETFRREPWAVPVILVGFMVGTILLIPITAMVFGIALVFPPIEALLLATTGAMVSSLALYGIGRYWVFTKSAFLNRSGVKKISERLSRGGVAAVTALRLAPIAPFSVVGIVAGGLRLKIFDYIVGSFLGFLPMVLALTYISTHATRGNIAMLVWGLAILSLIVSFAPRIARRMRGSHS
jgi:phospholipase D1/2